MTEQDIEMEVYGLLEYMGLDDTDVPEIYFDIAKHFYNLGKIENK